MPKRLKLKPHQTVEELSQLYRQTSDPIERTRYQIIWLLATGRVTEDVASVTGYCRNSIYRLVRRYNELGTDGLKDKRHQHPGCQPILSDVEQAQLMQTLQRPPADGGLWNSRKVAEWMSNLLDRPVSVQRGWDYLRSLELRLRVPRPEHELSDPEIEEAWKKKLRKRVQQIQEQHSSAAVEVWGMDEHRLGLKPISRRGKDSTWRAASS